MRYTRSLESAGRGYDNRYNLKRCRPQCIFSISVTHSASTTRVAPTSSTKTTEIWDKAIDLATPLGTFIIVVVAVALLLILLIALICVCVSIYWS